MTSNMCTDLVLGMCSVHDTAHVVMSTTKLKQDTSKACTCGPMLHAVCPCCMQAETGNWVLQLVHPLHAVALAGFARMWVCTPHITCVWPCLHVGAMTGFQCFNN